MDKRWAVVLFLLCAGGVCAKELIVGVGLDKPPYIIEDSSSGYELELIRQVMTLAGQNIRFSHLPFGRYHWILQNKSMDAVATLDKDVTSSHIFYSQPYITYQNAAISLKKNHFSIKQLSQLEGLVVVGFQQAEDILGEEFVQGISEARRYFELADQRKQVRMLLEGKVDVLIIDINIFRYISHLDENDDQLDDIDVHFLFEASPHRVGFYQQELRDAFDVALSQFYGSEEHKLLREKYKIMDLD